MGRVEVVKTLSNNYIIIEDNYCLIFDCGGRKILNRLKELRVEPKAIFITHLHFDHVVGVRSIVKEFENVKVYVPSYMIPELVYDITIGLGRLFLLGVKFNIISEDTKIRVDDIEVKAYRTSGHTIHHTCYTIDSEGILVIGDAGYVKNGKVVTRIDKIKSLLETSKYKIILPGHGKYLL